MKKKSIYAFLLVTFIFSIVSGFLYSDISDDTMIFFWLLVKDKKISAQTVRDFLDNAAGISDNTFFRPTSFQQYKRFENLGLHPEHIPAGDMPNESIGAFSNYLLVPSESVLSLNNALSLLKREYDFENLYNLSERNVSNIFGKRRKAEWLLYQTGDIYEGMSLKNVASLKKKEEHFFTLYEGIIFLLQQRRAVSRESTFQLLCAGSRTRVRNEERIPLLHVYKGKVFLITIQTNSSYRLGRTALASSYDYKFAYFESLFK